MIDQDVKQGADKFYCLILPAGLASPPTLLIKASAAVTHRKVKCSSILNCSSDESVL